MLSHVPQIVKMQQPTIEETLFNCVLEGAMVRAKFAVQKFKCDQCDEKYKM